MGGHILTLRLDRLLKNRKNRKKMKKELIKVSLLLVVLLISGNINKILTIDNEWYSYLMFLSFGSCPFLVSLFYYQTLKHYVPKSIMLGIVILSAKWVIDGFFEWQEIQSWFFNNSHYDLGIIVEWLIIVLIIFFSFVVQYNINKRMFDR